MAHTRAGEVVWDRAWQALWRRVTAPVHTQLHGRHVVLNAGHPYPAFLRRWPTYNMPLVELVLQSAATTGHPVRVVDVGAAVGDTALLLMDRAANAVAHIDCVEGDPEFIAYLQANVGKDGNVTIHPQLLSDAVGAIPQLVRTHAGTASAQGERAVDCTTLDALFGGGENRPEVVKTDTDGFDGRILAGGRRLLNDARPSVIFEWHPRLYAATANDWRLPFAVLGECGYDRFVWFTKFGEFSHTHHGADGEAIADLAALCLADRGPHPDWHFDVVALPHDSGVDPVKLAAMELSRAAPA